MALKEGDHGICYRCKLTVEWYGKPEPAVRIPGGLTSNGQPLLLTKVSGWCDKLGINRCGDSIHQVLAKEQGK